MAETLNAVTREQLGTKNTRRLRKSGQVPAVIYGHGEKTISLAIPTGEVHAAIRHGARLVDVKGAVTDSALIREVQWDAFGIEVLHLDLTRVSADETVQVYVVIELRGEAPGTKEGGVLQHVTHEVEIECLARSIPEKLEVSVNELHVGDSILAAALPLPEGGKLLSSTEAVVVQCVEAAVEDDEEAVPGADVAEPEVIGRKEEEEGSDE
jgi:large subunit ribosomal protein L25